MVAIGSRVKFQRGKRSVSGIVTTVYAPENMTIEDHGMIEVWLTKETGYGSNNCEHFCAINYSQYLKITEEPTLDDQFSVGTLHNTILGKALIVDSDVDMVTVFLYRQPNSHNPMSTGTEVVDTDDEFYETIDARMESDEHFDPSKHCIIVSRTQLLEYLTL